MQTSVLRPYTLALLRRSNVKTPASRVPSSLCCARTMAAQPSQSSGLSKDLTLPNRSQSQTTTTIPRLVYGTAWKKDRTADLVYAALASGFRGIDTAAQPRHYQEHLVGEGLRRAIADGLVTRRGIFLQTKFSPIGAQDPGNMPYDADAPLDEQVRTSVASSLKNLGVGEGDEPYLDSVVLHSPLRDMEDTILVWKTLSKYVPHQIRHLGISNSPSEIVEYLLEAPDVKVKPSVVQNRFYDKTDYEVTLRALCRHHGVVFQSFWTLSGNPRLVKSKLVEDLARAVGVEKEVAYYTLVLGLEGITILDGTTSEAHMTADLEGIEKVGQWAEGEGKQTWAEALLKFQTLIGDVES